MSQHSLVQLSEVFSVIVVSRPRRCFVAACSECYKDTFFFPENSTVMNFFFSASPGRVGTGGQGNSLAARWIHPSVLCYMGTWCPSVIPCASWWFPQEELHNYFFLNNSFFLLELGWRRNESCVRAGGRPVLSFCGYSTSDGCVKENLKWILKRSIQFSLCVWIPSDGSDEPVHRTMSYSLPLVICGTVWCVPGNMSAKFKVLCGVPGSQVDFQTKGFVRSVGLKLQCFLKQWQ